MSAPARYDLVVVGAGPAGEKGAAQAAYFGKRVALVDAGARPGGIATSSAGIPTKALREGALYLSGLAQEVFQGARAETPDPWRLLMTRRLEVSEFMTRAVERNLVRHAIDRLQGRARLRGAGRVDVVDSAGRSQVLETAAVLLATGTRPHWPSGIEVGDPDVHDSESILGIDQAPRSLAIVGAGAVGCEYASVFAALGVQVTLVDSRPQLLPALDVEMASVLAESFNGLGIRVLAGSEVAGVARGASGLEVRLEGGRVVRAEKVLVATGRRPCTAGLGLEEAGVQLGAGGYVRVDARYETSVPGVFAAGDLIGPPGLASAAMEQARVAVCHAFGIAFKTATDRFAPRYVFSIPEAAWVGFTEEEARRHSLDYEVGRASFATNAKARISGFADGLVKLLFRVPDKTLLGVHIVGEMASELIHVGQFVLQEGGTIDRFVDATFAVPSRSEAYKYAAYDGLMRLGRRQPAAAHALGR